MKKSILFVDDEPFILQGLQRVFRNMGNEWGMVFVEGGLKALAVMAEQRVDVMVTDMRMPVMNGAQLLREVQERFPMTPSHDMDPPLRINLLDTRGTGYRIAVLWANDECANIQGIPDEAFLELAKACHPRRA
jgi:CheY-like chemotaxis protein